MDNTMSNEVIETGLETMEGSGSGLFALIGFVGGFLMGIAACKLPAKIKSRKKKTEKADDQKPEAVEIDVEDLGEEKDS